ncbi:hypothetical protein Tco_0417048 [Tanacetum coccineum]
MNPIAAQQVALDNALVAPENRVQIGQCNMIIDPIKTQKEPTYQVVLDSLGLSPLYPTFLITAEVPEIYMHQFWHTITKIKNSSSYKFKLDKKHCKIDVEVFHDILQICPRLLNQEFDAPPSDEEILGDQVLLRVFPMSLTGAHCPPTRTTKKMEEINNFQQEPNETLYQASERFKELLMKCPQHYLTGMQEVILFYNGLDVLTRQILDLKGAIPTKTAADAKVAIQEITKYSQKLHNGTSRTRSTKTSNELASIQAQLNNLGREIKKVNEKVYAAQVGCEQCKGPYYTKDCPLKEEIKTLEEAYYT